ncbi:ABC transporter substrate-binding protein [Cohnella sp. GCM10027633]|uniref:ABC transporter substrate-binding protein n=1 Tax=unclassified Cohnella TaxID=2636738 RepID=UPI00363F760D
MIRKHLSAVKLATIAMLAFALVLGGCSNNGNNGEQASSQAAQPSASAEPSESSSAPAEPPVELTWYYIAYEMPTDLEAVNKAVNDFILPRINATIKLMPTIESSYGQKMNTMLAAGEDFDLMWTSNWGGGDYQNRVLKGAYQDLDDLLELTPKLKEALPELAWEDTKIAGKIWAVPNYQIAAKAEGFAIQKRFIDKYSIDVSTIKTQSDIEKVLEVIKQNEPDIIPIAGVSNMFDFGRQAGFTKYGYKAGDNMYTIHTIVETPEYKQFLDRQRSWYEKGYIYQDDATNPSLPDLLKTGTVAVEWDTTMKPGGEVDHKARFGGNEVVYVRVTEPEFTGVQPTMTAINRKSKHPEQALKFLELVNTEPELMNLLTYGIKDKHYTMVGDNQVKKIDGSGYVSNDWVMGNAIISYTQEGQDPDVWKKTHELNMSAKRPELSGFKYEASKVQTQIANTTAVHQEFSKALNTGSVDPNDYLPRYIDALKKAGQDEIMAEYQKQLDSYLAQQGLKEPAPKQ